MDSESADVGVIMASSEPLLAWSPFWQLEKLARVACSERIRFSTHSGDGMGTQGSQASHPSYLLVLPFRSCCGSSLCRFLFLPFPLRFHEISA